MGENEYIYLNVSSVFHTINFLLVTTGNELNSDLKLAAQIVLALVILIITLLLILPRFVTDNTAMLIPTMWVLLLHNLELPI